MKYCIFPELNQLQSTCCVATPNFVFLTSGSGSSSSLRRGLPSVNGSFRVMQKNNIAEMSHKITAKMQTIPDRPSLHPVKDFRHTLEAKDTY